MGEADNYYFDVNWEVCTRCGENLLFFKDRLRSAVRVIDKYYYLAGPDLKSRPEFSEPDEGWRRLIYNGAGLSREFGWRLPGEPRAVFANFGRKMNAKFHLYELWEDSGLVIKESGWSCLEPVMFSHACRAILDLVAGPGEKTDLFFGTGRLCVKRKMPEPETVLNSVASFTGRLNYSGYVNIYFESKRPEEKGAVVPAGAPSRVFSFPAEPGAAPLSCGPLLIRYAKRPAALFPALAGSEKAGISGEPVNKFFARIRLEEGSSLSSFLWLMDG
jgi:hypothetical protein